MGTHWYDKNNGDPVYEVPYADPSKGNRPTTLSDARKLGLVPSVTGIIDMADKPALVTWKANQILDAAWMYRKTNIEEKLWKGMVRKQSEKIGKDSAALGNKIHNAIEHVLTTPNIPPKEIVAHCLKQYIDEPLRTIMEDRFFPHISEKSFSHKDGFGGKVDLHGKDFVLDFKTKDKEWAEGDKLAYDGHCMQLAAYREGLGMPNAKCYNLFISTKKPGLVYLHEWTEAEMQRGWKMFQCLLNYWKLVNNFG